jgi:MinD-like ATPase involved in chromosome partitioning or flagellar assembly
VAKIISTHSFRGGTGKSNTTANLAVMVARAGKRVGVVDTDIQSPGIHLIFHLDDGKVQTTLNDYLWGRAKIEQTAYDVTAAAIGDFVEGARSPRLFLIPSSIKTGEIARILSEGYDVGRLNDGFRELIERLDLDYLFIDTHPGVNEETLLSIAVSDVLVLILRPDSQDFQGTAVTVELARRLEVNSLFMVVNKIPPTLDCSALKKQVESAYGAEVIGMLPLNAEMARLGSQTIFANCYPEHPFTQELANVAGRLLA